ncbi:hypothetical protein O181_110767 [Austropuccinia psidii MF-1]|uniref:Integrase catalytic domain-containing protein n=1 Tax=Austropuccinia psidii MF-1 TaxID=1389203 RepID=A0A9Q3K0G5_9BASI|nr:hypothetical protein [Austropuccinia psidii MF-1]
MPAYLHPDHGGEFSSLLFLSYLKDHGISLERGPPESPQTNGVAERFNEKLLSKVQFLLRQSKIHSSYWDKAELHVSLILNVLPHKHLNIKSPMAVVEDNKCLIELIIRYERLIPFGIKVTTKILTPSSKVEPRREIICALTFEKNSDVLRLLNLEMGKFELQETIPHQKPIQSLLCVRNLLSFLPWFQLPSS